METTSSWYFVDTNAEMIDAIFWNGRHDSLRPKQFRIFSYQKCFKCLPFQSSTCRRNPFEKGALLMRSSPENFKTFPKTFF